MKEIVESIYTFLENNLWVLALLSLASLAGMIWSARQLIGLQTAKFVAEGGQYLRLPDDQINEAIEDAAQKGNDKEFLALLRQIRREHGHTGVKIGHLYWIWDKIEKGETEVDKTPSFVNEEVEEDLLRAGALRLLLKKIEPYPEELRDRIAKEVIELRGQRESELNKQPLSANEIIAVFNEVLNSNEVELITQSELEKAVAAQSGKID